MIISEKRLRRLIRSIVLEQVVGYQAPKRTYDDPLGDEDHTFSTPAGSSGGSEAVTGKSDSDDDSAGYMQIGDVSVPTSKSDTVTQKTAGASLSPQDQDQMRAQIGTLQKQRQDSFNKGDAKQADYYGVQIKRIKDVLNPV
jgi:hypothetical protein